MKGRRPFVCMLVFSYPPEATGGAERQCRFQARELARRGCRCLVLATRRSWATPARERNEECEVVRVATVEAWRDRFRKSGRGREEAPDSSLFQAKAAPHSRVAVLAAAAVRWLNALFLMALTVSQLVRHRKEIDVLHTHVADWNAGFAGWIGHHLGIPVVAKAAFLPAFAPIAGVPWSCRWTEWRRRVHYVALTEAMAENLAEEGVPRNRIRVVPNGVALPPEPARPDLYSTVLYVGNLTQGAAHKAFDILLDAWSRVAAVRPDARLRIAGAGDPSPWCALAERLGCAGSIQFSGYLEDLSACYREAALLALPSRGEGMSNALLEGLAWGLPAVVSDIPGNRELVVDGVNGRVVRVGDAETLSQAILDLLVAPDLRRLMGARAREGVRHSYSAEAVVDRLFAVYAEIMADPTSDPSASRNRESA